MKKLVILLVFLTFSFLFSACEKPTPVPPPAPSVEAHTAPLPVQEQEQTQAKEEEPKPAPGMAVFADGTRLPSGSLLINGVSYLNLEELLDALDAEMPGYGVFWWQKIAVHLKPNSRQVVFWTENRSDFLLHPVLSLNQTLYVPVELCEMLGMGLYRDDAQNLLYITPGGGTFSIPEGYCVPTLMYHAVGDDLWGFPELFVSPAELEAQLKYLTENGYTTIHFSDLRAIDRIKKPVLLTFDDGYLDNYTNLYPLLQKYNCKATIFVITEMVGVHERYMTWEQAKEMADSGLVSIQSHTATHPNLDELTREEQLLELTESSRTIAEHLYRIPYVLCYPTGRYNNDTLELMNGLYSFGLKMAGNQYTTGEDPLLIDRWYIPRGLHPGTFGDMVGYP